MTFKIILTLDELLGWESTQVSGPSKLLKAGFHAF